MKKTKKQSKEKHPWMHVSLSDTILLLIPPSSWYNKLILIWWRERWKLRNCERKSGTLLKMIYKHAIPRPKEDCSKIQQMGVSVSVGCSEELSVHKSQIRFEVSRSFADDDPVEFQSDNDNDGRSKAVDVTGIRYGGGGDGGSGGGGGVLGCSGGESGGGGYGGGYGGGGGGYGGSGGENGGGGGYGGGGCRGVVDGGFLKPQTL